MANKVYLVYGYSQDSQSEFALVFTTYEKAFGCFNQERNAVTKAGLRNKFFDYGENNDKQLVYTDKDNIKRQIILKESKLI